MPAQYASSGGSSVEEVIETLEPRAKVVRVSVVVSAFLFIILSVFYSSQVSALTGWDYTDIGNPQGGSSHQFSDGNFALSANGSDIWWNNDSFSYLNKRVSSGFEITIKVDSIDNTDPWAKVGLMVRESKSVGSKHLFMMTTPGANGINFQGREQTGGSSWQYKPSQPGNYPKWLRIKRQANNYIVYYSTDGQNFTEFGSKTLDLGSNPYVGVALTSHKPSVSTYALIRDLSLTVGSSPTLPPVNPPDSGSITPFNSKADIGNSGTGTVTGYGGGNMDIIGGGTDIWGNSDSFRYVYTNKGGNYELVTRVDSLEPVDDWTKGGLMIRANTAANSPYVFVFKTPGWGLHYQYRDSGGTHSVVAGSNSSTGVGFPKYLKLQKYGNVYTASLSSNGSSWENVGDPLEVNLGSNPLAGLAVTAHKQGDFATARFREVSFASITTLPPPPLPGPEICGDGIDNDQDGEIDEGCALPPPMEKPDLTIVNKIGGTNPKITGPTQVTVGQQATYEARTTNIGEAQAPTSYTRAEAPGSNTDRRDYSVGNVAPGGYFIHSFTTSWATAGSYQVKFIADVGVDTPDDDRSNNTKTINVTVVEAESPPLPPDSEMIQPLSDIADIGNSGVGSTTGYGGGKMDIIGGGSDIWWNSDAFRYVYTNKGGDYEFATKIDLLENVDPWTKAGVMIRANTATDSPYVFVFKTPGSLGVNYQYRNTAGANSRVIAYNPNNSGLGFPKYLKLAKDGNNFVASFSADGNTYTNLGAHNVNLGTNPLAGIAVTAHKQDDFATAKFTDTSFSSITTSPTPLSCAGDLSFSLAAGSSIINGQGQKHVITAGSPLKFTASGMSNCEGKIVKVDYMTSSSDWSELVRCTFTNGKCETDFNTPTTPGLFTVLARMDSNGDGTFNKDAGFYMYLDLTSPEPPPLSCTGTPTFSLGNADTTINGKDQVLTIVKGTPIRAEIHGMNNCNGKKGKLLIWESNVWRDYQTKDFLGDNWAAEFSVDKDPATYITKVTVDKDSDGVDEGGEDSYWMNLKVTGSQPGPSQEAICPNQCTKEQIAAYVSTTVPEPYKSTIYIMLDTESDGGDWGALANEGWNCPTLDPCHGVLQFKIGTWDSAKQYSNGTWSPNDIYPDFISVWDLRGAYPDHNVWNPYGQIDIAYEYLKNCWYTHWPWMPRPSYCAAPSVPL